MQSVACCNNQLGAPQTSRSVSDPPLGCGVPLGLSANDSLDVHANRPPIESKRPLLHIPHFGSIFGKLPPMGAIISEIDSNGSVDFSDVSSIGLMPHPCAKSAPTPHLSNTASHDYLWGEAHLMSALPEAIVQAKDATFVTTEEDVSCASASWELEGGYEDTLQHL